MRKVLNALKNKFFNGCFSVINYFLTAVELLLFINIISKNQQTGTNKLEPRSFEITRSIKATKLNSFQWEPVNTLNYASMGRQVCFSFIIHQKELITSY